MSIVFVRRLAHRVAITLVNKALCLKPTASLRSTQIKSRNKLLVSIQLLNLGRHYMSIDLLVSRNGCSGAQPCRPYEYVDGSCRLSKRLLKHCYSCVDSSPVPPVTPQNMLSPPVDLLKTVQISDEMTETPVLLLANRRSLRSSRYHITCFPLNGCGCTVCCRLRTQGIS